MGKYAGLGFQFAGAILLFGFLGQWADRRFGTTPWGVIVGVAIGFFGGMWKLYSMAKENDASGGSDAGGGPR